MQGHLLQPPQEYASTHGGKQHRVRCWVACTHEVGSSRTLSMHTSLSVRGQADVTQANVTQSHTYAPALEEARLEACECHSHLEVQLLARINSQCLSLVGGTQVGLRGGSKCDRNDIGQGLLPGRIWPAKTVWRIWPAKTVSHLLH
jgi:hypothetical protein